MVASVSIVEITGSSPTYTTITDRVRLFTADQATTQGSPQTTYPVPIPTSPNYSYSYWKAICLQLAGAGFTITNIRHYSNGDFYTPSSNYWTLGTGGQVRRGNRDYGDKGCPTYAQAGGSIGVNGYAIEDALNGHPYYMNETVPTADLNSDTVSSPATIDSSIYTIAGYTKHIVLQVKVASDAVQGTMTAKTLTWVYDES